MSANPAYNKQRHRDWSEVVMRRDKHLCQDCKRYGRMVPAEVAHHIQPITERPDIAYSLSNGIALCHKCHSKRHPEKGGSYDNTDAVTSATFPIDYVNTEGRNPQDMQLRAG